MRLDYLPLEYREPEGLLYFEGKALAPEVRTLEQMRPVLRDPEADAPPELYYMYRDICLPGHRELITHHKLRYDITIIPSLLLGEEYNKTLGHFHAEVPGGSGLSYTEVYEVLSGEAHYLLQDEDTLTVVSAGKGDKVVVPPNCGHVTINPGKEVLIMANWVSTEFKSEYGTIKEMHGAAYYELEGNRLVPNPSYTSEFKLMRESAKEHPEFGLERATPMYTSFMEHPEKFKFLTHPQEFF